MNNTKLIDFRKRSKTFNKDSFGRNREACDICGRPMAPGEHGAHRCCEQRMANQWRSVNTLNEALEVMA